MHETENVLLLFRKCYCFYNRVCVQVDDEINHTMLSSPFNMSSVGLTRRVLVSSLSVMYSRCCLKLSFAFRESFRMAVNALNNEHTSCVPRSTPATLPSCFKDSTSFSKQPNSANSSCKGERETAPVRVRGKQLLYGKQLTC